METQSQTHNTPPTIQNIQISEELLPTPQEAAVTEIKRQHALNSLTKRAKKAKYLPQELTKKHFIMHEKQFTENQLLMSLLAELNKNIMAKAVAAPNNEARFIYTEYAKCILQGEATRQLLMNFSKQCPDVALAVRLVAATEYAYNRRINLAVRVESLNYMVFSGALKDQTHNDLSLSLYGLEKWLKSLLTITSSADETTHLIHGHQYIYGAKSYMSSFWKKENYQ